jgi:hypothetical protein
MFGLRFGVPQEEMKHCGLMMNIKIEIEIVEKRVFHFVIRGLPNYCFVAIPWDTLG